MKKAIKLGFLGGSFDPVHVGHMLLALDALDQLGLDRVYFVPALTSPLREAPHTASFSDRLAMLQPVIAGHDSLGVLDIEESLPQPSYTINTARILSERFPEAQLYWLIGADQLEKLPSWKNISQLVRTLRFGVAARPGSSTKIPDVSGLSVEFLNQRLVDVSSSEIRQRLARNLPVIGMTMSEIVDYINQHSLYRSTQHE